MLSRRDFLAATAAGLAGAAGAAGTAACRPSGASRDSADAAGAAASPPLTTPRRRLERIGIQLYTVRQEMQRDMPGTIARIAEIGYREVEFAGYFGRTPSDVRRLLEHNKLAAPSTHVGLDAVRANWDRTLDEAAEIGHRFVTVPWVPDDVRGSRDTWRRVAEEFNRAGERARAKGLRFAYHNHDFEFTRVDGVLPFDLLIAETDPALVSFQMDVYWTVKAGGDPRAYIRQHPTRFTMLHVKDSAGPPNHAQVDVGAGTIDFAAILRQDADLQHVVAHAFIEHDSPPDPMAFAKTSFDYLSRLEY